MNSIAQCRIEKQHDGSTLMAIDFTNGDHREFIGRDKGRMAWTEWSANQQREINLGLGFQLSLTRRYLDRTVGR